MSKNRSLQDKNVVKYIYKKQKNIYVIKKNLTIRFTCENEQNEVADVRGNEIMKTLAPIPHIRL